MTARDAFATPILHALPPLPYEAHALEPAISGRTIGFHHGKHHQGYIDTLNKLIGATPLALLTLDELLVETAGNPGQATIFRNAAQVWNHNFYSRSLRPRNDAPPPPVLSQLIHAAFGDLPTCRKELAAAAAAQFGSGWVWLVQEAGTLKVLSTGNAAMPVGPETKRLLTIDVWEHAYYLDYQNRRTDHVDAVLEHLINWDFAADNLA
ncbi:MAG TPA: superoxide dismutase [Usitatibacteraceae bacterium]|nr:superoxide dismutase [Usitatibacteraceae bacterium]